MYPNEIKGLLLAGGRGTRLQPLSNFLNKHLIPIGRYPMIFHSLMTLKRSGIDNVCVVCNVDDIHAISRVLGNGSEVDMSIAYVVDVGRRGVAGALQNCKGFASNSAIAVMLADNIFSEPLDQYVAEFKEQLSSIGGARVILKEVTNPEEFGVASLGLQGQVVDIEEKPQAMRGSLAVTGFYLFDEKAFRFIERIEPSARGEYEITDLNNVYARHGLLMHNTYSGSWVDAGTFNGLEAASVILRNVVY